MGLTSRFKEVIGRIHPQDFPKRACANFKTRKIAANHLPKRLPEPTNKARYKHPCRIIIIITSQITIRFSLTFHWYRSSNLHLRSETRDFPMRTGTLKFLKRCSSNILQTKVHSTLTQCQQLTTKTFIMNVWLIQRSGPNSTFKRCSSSTLGITLTRP